MGPKEPRSGRPARFQTQVLSLTQSAIIILFPFWITLPLQTTLIPPLPMYPAFFSPQSKDIKITGFHARKTYVRTQATN